MAKKLTIGQRARAYQEKMRLLREKVATIKLNKHDVFKSADTTGDFANTLFFFDGRITNRFGTEYYHILALDGTSDWYSLVELNPDTATIRPYNADTDGDFYGACG